MRAVLQRVSVASVVVDQQTVGSIGTGLMVLLGVEPDDSEQDLRYLVDKIIGLRVFEDDAGKMNLSLDDIHGSLLVVSQFTLLGDARKGKRPSFIKAAGPELGKQMYDAFVQYARDCGIHVETGKFGAMMSVSLVNQGPVTLLLDSKRQF